MKKILIFLPYGGVSPHHYSIALEILEDHIAKGNDITVLRCNSCMRSCSYNLSKNLSACIHCNSIFEQGLKLLSGSVRVKDYRFLTTEDRSQLQNLNPNFQTLEQLKSFKIDNFDLGMGVASSIVSWFRDPYVDISANSKIINNLLHAAFEVYLSMKNHLKAGVYDEVYLFNGRHAEFRGVFRAAQALKTEARLYEYGSVITKYAVYENYLPHSIENTTRLVNKAWSNCRDEKLRMEIARNFFEVKFYGTDSLSYTKDQNRKLLPENFISDKKNIVIFNSSEDELVAIGDEWNNKLYSSQIDGIVKVCKSLQQFQNANDYHIYLRMHPNLIGVDNPENELLKKLDPSVFTIIPPESKISSYTMMEKANLVMAFGSTMGMEATYWGKPSIQIGPSYYQELDATYFPQTHEEVMELIRSKDLEPKSRIGAFKYGYYMSTHGIDKKISKMKDFITLDTIKGQTLTPIGIAKLKLDLLFVCNNPLKYLRLKLNRFKRRQSDKPHSSTGNNS